jgi:glucose/arabinose dehydrogenase
MKDFCLYLSLLYVFPLAAQLPAGFTDELFTDEITTPVGIAFPDSHLVYVWEQDGRIEIFERGRKLGTPLLDLSEEVSGTADHGLLGLALHPDFRKNGYLYLSYVVDPHYLLYFGSPEYDLQQLQTWNATIARVTRYQVDTSGFKSVLEGSRKVLIGDSINNGIPVLAPAHGIGGLDFGTDGTLLIGTGDGTTWVGNHTGGTDYQEFGFDSLGKILGIIDALQDVGSLRSQMPDSYSGKILRIDPLTGSGIPGNPFYDPQNPNAARSRVWALGFRSPFRLRVQPGSGEEDPALAKPGIIFVGDVGSNQFEELNVVTGPGQNFGWPLYEGMSINSGFYNQWIPNPYAPNPDSGICALKYYRFNDLITDARKDHRIIQPDPCDSSKKLDDKYPVFVHNQPAVAYGNTKNNPLTTQIPYYNENGIADYLDLESGPSPATGANFDGISSVAGDFYEAGTFPPEYKGLYFHADFGGWIRTMEYDDENPEKIKNIRPFLTDSRSVVFLKFNPFDRQLYYVVLDYRERPNVYQVRKITFGENPRPRAIIEADTLFGYTPFTVHLSSAASYDPEGENLTRQWYFNEQPAGTFSDTIISLTSSQPENFRVSLTVTDAYGQKDSTSLNISLNNTPPNVKILSPENGFQYPAGGDLLLINMEAEVSDAEHTSLSYYWEIKLKHNDHFHVEFTDTVPFTETHLVPLSSTELDEHSYLISLTVTDPLGLQGQDEVIIEPSMTTGTRSVDPADHLFNIYPNPASNFLHITARRSDIRLPLKIGLYDMLGQIKKEMSIQQLTGTPLKIDLQDLPPGMYLLNISSRQNTVEQRKIIVH